MQKSLDPNMQQTFVLASDIDKDYEVQPRFAVRTLKINQMRKLMKSMQDMRAASGDPDKLFDSALDAAEICIAGWKNVRHPETDEPLEFSREHIGEVFSIDELAELFDVVVSSSKPSAGDQKKSE
jgi:hypothetical protein